MRLIKQQDQRRDKCPRPGLVSHRSGVAVVEMALLLPLLLAFTLGAAEYGYAIYVKHTLTAAAREGARTAVVVGATLTDVQTAVTNVMSSSGFAQSEYTWPPTITPSTWATAPAGTTITVQVQATWGQIGISVLPAGGIPKTKTVSAATAMRKEG